MEGLCSCFLPWELMFICLVIGSGSTMTLHFKQLVMWQQCNAWNTSQDFQFIFIYKCPQRLESMMCKFFFNNPVSRSSVEIPCWWKSLACEPIPTVTYRLMCMTNPDQKFLSFVLYKLCACVRASQKITKLWKVLCYFKPFLSLL